EPGRAIHVRAAIISARFPGMNRHPDTHRNVSWPGLRTKRALNLTRSRDRAGRSRKNGKDAVALAKVQKTHTVPRFDPPPHRPIPRTAAGSGTRLQLSLQPEGPIKLVGVEVDVEEAYLVSRPGLHRVVPCALLLVPVLGFSW